MSRNPNCTRCVHERAAPLRRQGGTWLPLSDLPRPAICEASPAHLFSVSPTPPRVTRRPRPHVWRAAGHANSQRKAGPDAGHATGRRTPGLFKVLESNAAAFFYSFLFVCSVCVGDLSRKVSGHRERSSKDLFTRYATCRMPHAVCHM